LFGHAVTSKLTVFYHAAVIGSMRSFAKLQRCSGERHENLPADGADRYTFDRDSLHFSARAEIENASAITSLLKA
jgi:hypothetical protein